MDRQLIKRHLLLLAVLAATTHSTAFARSAAEADRAVRDQGSMLGGAARGAARGAIFGAIVGDSGRATRRGAALGAGVGAVKRGARNNDIYRRVYDDCMRGIRYGY